MLQKMLRNLPLLGYVFFVAYSPPVGPSPVVFQYLLLVLVPATLGLHYWASGYSSVASLLTRPRVLLLVAGALMGSVHVFAVQVLRGRDVSSLADTRLLQNNLVLLIAVNVVFIVDLMYRRGFSPRQSFEVLLWLGGLQGVLSLLGVISDSVKSFSNALYMASGNANEFVMASRVYGVSSDFTYSTPIYHGMLAGLAAHYALTDRRIYWHWVLLLLVTTVLNGRTGIVVFLAIVFLSLVVTSLRRGNVFRLVSGFAGVGVLWVASMALLERFVPSSFAFVNAFVIDTLNLIDGGEATGNYSVLLQEVQMLPEGAGLVFGEGVRLFTGTDMGRTDIGLTNDLFAGGVVYVVFVYGALLLFVFARPRNPLVAVMLVCATSIANLKGEFFHSSILLFGVLFIVLLWELESWSEQQVFEGSAETYVAGSNG